MDNYNHQSQQHPGQVYVEPHQQQYQAQPQPQTQQAPAQTQQAPEMSSLIDISDHVRVNVILDKESTRILKEASAVHSEAIINLGIKLFAKTDTYKDFMRLEEFRDIETKSNDQVTNQSNTTQSAQSVQTSQSAQSNAQAPTQTANTQFSEW